MIQKEREILVSSNDTTPAIDANTRHELIRIIVDFMIEKYGLKPNAYQKMNTAIVAVAVFPRLKFNKSKSDGTVSGPNLNIKLE